MYRESGAALVREHGMDKQVMDNYPGVVLQLDCATSEILAFAGTACACWFPRLAAGKNRTLDDIRRHIDPEQKPIVQQRTRACLQTGSAWDMEYAIRREGQTLWLREQASGEDDNAAGGKVRFLYISEITQSWQKYQKAKSELAAMQSAVSSKNEFFASMSHEIRTPMNAVMGMAQILAKTSLDSEQKQYVNTIIGSSNALVQIINDILDLSKLEAGKIDIVTESVDLEALCLDVCQLLATRAHEKSLPLYFNYQVADVRKIHTDAGRLRQILVNLLGNAIKFTESGHVELLVDYFESGGEPMLRFSVKDTGIGIPESALASLFQAYSQADDTISRRFGGTGLGLQICQRLVQLLGGEMGVRSEEGKGSEFWFYLPLDGVEQAPEPVLNDKHCLLLDADEHNRQILIRALAQAGVEAIAVDSIDSAIAMLSDTADYQAIIIAEALPDSEGVALAKQISAAVPACQGKIILLGAMQVGLNSASLYQAGIGAYLGKPFSPRLIYKALQVVEAADHGNKAVFVGQDAMENKNTADGHAVRASGLALIAEDVEVNQVILNSMLTQIGLHTQIANNGEEALEKVKTRQFDIVFMDCRMPVMDGFEATRRIRALENVDPDLPIVALTANASEQDKQACLAAGMTDFLSKPYAEKDLLEIIQKWLPTTSQEILPDTAEVVVPQENVILDQLQFDSIKDSLAEEFSNFALDITDKFMNYQEEIIAALKTGNMQAVAEKGHSLKGIAAMIGARQVAEIALRIEQAGNEEPLEVAYESAIAALTQLDAAISKTHSMIIINLNPEIDKSLYLFQ